MKTIIKNTVLVFLGLLLGSFVNMGILIAGSSLIPLPKGVSMANPQSLKAGIRLFEPIHFVTPFLAHALGTFIGAFLVAKFAASNKFTLAMIVGAFFLLGGISNMISIPAPNWFCAIDLLFAYIPMAFLGWKITTMKK